MRSVVTALCLMLLALPALAQITGVATSIPRSAFGTWQLVMEGATIYSPFPNETTATLTIAIDGSICSSGFFAKEPTTKDGITNTIFWVQPTNNLEFSLNTGQSFSGVSVASASGVSYGFFRVEEGSVATNEGTCDKSQLFFELAEANYPDLFPEGTFILTHLTSSEFYRYYSATDTSLVIRNGTASASGGKFGSTPVTLGNVSALVAAGVDNLPIPVTAAPSSFDSYYAGTYRFTFQNASTFSPVSNGAQLTFVITADNKLCAGETVLESPLLLQDADTVLWQNNEGGYYYSLSLLPNSTRDSSFSQGRLDMFSSNGRQYGSFAGTRTSLSAECADARGVNPDLSEINLMFGLAEQRLPALFPGGPLTYNQQNNGAVFRFYEATGVTVSVSNRQVSVKGGSFGPNAISAGTLDKVIASLQASTMSVTLPSALTGTYALTFAAAGGFSPVPTGTKADVAITEDGNLCMDGTLYTNPTVDLANVNLLKWKNQQTGYVLQVDTASSTGTTLSVQMQTLKGEVIGNLTGGKTQLLAKCAGLVGGNINIDAANQLFSLAEQRQPATFPPSALTYNQLSDGSLKRYYPATGVLVTVNGDSVQVSGGAFGNTPYALGKVADLVKQLSPTVQNTAALAVSGDMTFKQGNLPAIARRVSINETVAMPLSTTDADLTRLVEQQLGNELNGTSTYLFTIVSNTSTRLEFTVRIANATTIAGSVISRAYDLRFIYSRN